MRRPAAVAAMTIMVVIATVLTGCDRSGSGPRGGEPTWGDRAVTPTVQTPDHSGVGGSPDGGQ
jgi:hypothetical protein